MCEYLFNIGLSGAGHFICSLNHSLVLFVLDCVVKYSLFLFIISFLLFFLFSMCGTFNICVADSTYLLYFQQICGTFNICAARSTYERHAQDM